MKSQVQCALDEHVAHGAVRGRGPVQIFGYAMGLLTSRHLVPDPLPHPSSSVTLSLHGFSQLDDYSCGAVAGWCVVHSFDSHRSFNKFYKACQVTTKQGVTMVNLMRALCGSGVDVEYRRQVTFDRICAWVDAGHPVICNVQHERGEDARHWLVVYGYRQTPPTVLVAGNGWLSALGVSVEGHHHLRWGEFKRMFKANAIVCRRAGAASGRDGLRVQGLV